MMMKITMSIETLQALQMALHTAREDVAAAPVAAPAVAGLHLEISEALARTVPAADSAGMLDALHSAAFLVSGMEDDMSIPGEWEPETVTFLRRSAADLAAIAIRLHADLEGGHVR